PASAVSALTSLPAGGPAPTAGGAILGTFQDLAPGQREGRGADGRTHIFSLGAGRFEKATGGRGVLGRSRASLIGSILKDEPPEVSSVQPMTPPALDRVVKTCLAKDPEERWQSTADIKRQLIGIAEAPGIASSAVVSSGIRRERVAWAL